MKHGAFALATYRRRVAALALAVAATAASGACADGGAKSGIASSFRVEVAPLPLSGLTNATYVVTVTDGAGARLYESTVSADRYGDGISAISFDAPCHPDAPQHRIALALDSLETVAGKLVSGVDFDNPAPLDAPVEVGRTCVAGDVVPVRFELAPARRTSTGFFDVAVEWDDLLCRARLACDADPDSKVVPVLVDPLTGEPGPTALLELACAAPPGDPVVLYMSTVLVRCGGQLFPVDVAAGPGLLDPPYDDPEADLLFQAAITRSQGAVGGYDVTSWQVALGLNPVALAALPACTVEAAATAARTAFPGDATPDGVRWPYVRWEVPLPEGGGAFTCAHEVGDGSGVDLRFTDGPPLAFAASYSASDGACQVGDDAPAAICREAAGACDVAEVCDGQTASCPADAVAPVGTVCREAASACDAPEACDGVGVACPPDAAAGAGTPCEDDGDPCTVDTCDGAGACTHVPGNAGVVCRAAAGACDVAEVCDGEIAGCPADAVVAVGTTCRASQGFCDVAEACDGVAAACPEDGFVAAATECRPSQGACDPAEACTGAAPSCPADVRSPAGTTCREAAGPCDAAEVCDGSAAACPADAFAPATTECRPSAGLCDVAERCPGDAAGCPTDARVEAGTVCRAKGGDCDVAEVCNGGSADCPADGKVAGGTTCRGAAGPCDVAEACDGVASACPADVFLSAFEVCRPSGGLCDVAERCPGDGAQCGADEKRPSGAECRAKNDQCDVAETCDGVSNGCPANGYAGAGTACGSSGAAGCDAPDSCDGAGACVDRVATQGTTCRAGNGVCDPAEVCDGATKTCPANAFAASGTTCGSSSAADCDAPDSCDGAGACVDRVDPATTICRAAVDVCDVTERCTGSSKTCPANGFAASGTTCGSSSAADCDAPDSCDGGGACVDRVDPATTVCRAAVDVCDVAERCTGSSKTCPANGFASAGTSCGSTSAADCDAPDSCDGGGACVDRVDPATTVCRAAVDVCDVTERCTGSSKACPANGFAPSGTACGSSSATACDAPDSCDGGGACVDRVDPQGTVCRAGDGVCNPAERCDGGAKTCPADGGNVAGGSCGSCGRCTTAGCGSQCSGYCCEPGICVTGGADCP